MQIGGKKREKRMYEGTIYIANLNLDVPMQSIVATAENDVHDSISFPRNKWFALRLVDQMLKVNQAVSYRGCDFLIVEVRKEKNQVVLDAVNSALRGEPIIAEYNKVYPARTKPPKFKFVG